MDRIDPKALSKEFRTSDSSISIYNHETGINITFGQPKYLRDNEGVYGAEICVPANDLDYDDVFRTVVAIVKKCLRDKSTGKEIYAQLVVNLYNSRLVDAEIFKVFEA